VHLKRNEKFDTVGEDLKNAKINRIRLVAMGTEKRLSAIREGKIDIGAVSATKATLEEAKSLSGVKYASQGTQNYAYVGINTEYVPEVEIRQAIMRAINRKSMLGYYTAELAEIVDRPIATDTWAVAVDEEGNALGLYESMQYTRTVSEIETLVESAGYRKNGEGRYAKNGKTLDYTFLIPADGNDHFAYQSFAEAVAWLNEACGFNVTLVCDEEATPTQGGFAVWADVRKISLDPDLYDVFHKDGAKAYANGWGYSSIILNETGAYTDEKTALTTFSSVLEKARNILNRKERLELYAEAYTYLEQLCIELPVCQTKNLVAYNAKKLNENTFNKDVGFYAGAFDKLWEINFK
jgi:ABC-type transport system substrate-binding protein